jgi:O-antigen ligase
MQPKNTHSRLFTATINLFDKIVWTKLQALLSFLLFTIQLFMKKALKFILLGLLALVVLVLVAAAILPSEYAVERSVVI